MAHYLHTLDDNKLYYQLIFAYAGVGNYSLKEIWGELNKD